jgi:GMP synthase (glutamine-hydrolysing)
VELPPGAEVLGGNATTRYAALAIGPRILTLQPHPEFPAGVVEILLETRAQTVPDDLCAAARAGLSEPIDSARVADWIGDVIDGAPAGRVPFAQAARA